MSFEVGYKIYGDSGVSVPKGHISIVDGKGDSGLLRDLELAIHQSRRTREFINRRFKSKSKKQFKSSLFRDHKPLSDEFLNKYKGLYCHE